MAWLDRAYALIPDEMRPRTLDPGGSAPTGAWHGPSDPRGTLDAVQAALAVPPERGSRRRLLDHHGRRHQGGARRGGAAALARLVAASRRSRASRARPTRRSGAGHRCARTASAPAASTAWPIDRGWVPPPEITLNGAAAEQAGAAASRGGAAGEGGGRAAADRAAAEALSRAAGPAQVDGALRMFVDYATRSAVSPQPFLALGAGLCLVGAVAGRRYRTPTDLRSNLYAIGIADSGGGKDHARRCAKRALHAAGLDRYLGGEDFASSAGLLTSLQLHPARLFQLDEFGQFLKLVLAPRAPVPQGGHLVRADQALHLGRRALHRRRIRRPEGAAARHHRAALRLPLGRHRARPVLAGAGGRRAGGRLARALPGVPDRRRLPGAQRAPGADGPAGDLVAALKAIAAGAPATTMAATSPRSWRRRRRDPALHRAAGARRGRGHGGGPAGGHRAACARTAARYATALFGRYAENTAKLAMLAADQPRSRPAGHARPETSPGRARWSSTASARCCARPSGASPTTPPRRRTRRCWRSSAPLAGSAAAHFVAQDPVPDQARARGNLDALLESKQIAQHRSDGAKPTIFSGAGTSATGRPAQVRLEESECITRRDSAETQARGRFHAHSSILNSSRGRMQGRLRVRACVGERDQLNELNILNDFIIYRPSLHLARAPS